MTKEQLLTLFKDSVSNLRKATKFKLDAQGKPILDAQGRTTPDNLDLFLVWKNQCERITKEVELLNSEDREWIDAEYSIWFKENIDRIAKKDLTRTE